MGHLPTSARIPSAKLKQAQAVFHGLLKLIVEDSTLWINLLVSHSHPVEPRELVLLGPIPSI